MKAKCILLMLALGASFAFGETCIVDEGTEVYSVSEAVSDPPFPAVFIPCFSTEGWADLDVEFDSHKCGFMLLVR